MDSMRSIRDNLIIAVDYGTTYTGVAWQVIRQDPNEPRQDAVMLQSWPGHVHPKVPSVFTYDPSRNRDTQWGFNARSSPNKFLHTKLELDRNGRKQELQLVKDLLTKIRFPQGPNNRQTLPATSHLAHDPVTVVSDYLGRIRQYLMKELESRFNETELREFAVEIIISVPAAWTLEAKNRTFRAFVKAGFTRKYFEGFQGIFMVSEPEAAALHTVKSLLMDSEMEENNFFLEYDDHVVHVDMGGGTVDTIAYQVVAINPMVKFKKVGEATGNKFGSMCIDQCFLDWVRNKLGEHNYSRLTRGAGQPQNETVGSSVNEQKLLDLFIPIKHQYRGDAVGKKIDLAGSPLWNLEDVDRGIHEGQIDLTRDDFRAIFRPCVNRAIDLIEDQVNDVKLKTGRDTKYILISGGLSQCPYILDQIKEFGHERAIVVHASRNPVEAVVRGALAKRIEHLDDGVFRMVECDRSYGIRIDEPFSELLHTTQDSYRNPFDGRQKAQDQMLWLVKRGDLLLSGEMMNMEATFNRRYLPQDDELVTTLVEYRGSDAPQRFSDLQQSETTSTEVRYRLGNQVARNIRRAPARQRGTEHLKAELKAELVIERHGFGNEVRFRILSDSRLLAQVDL